MTYCQCSILTFYLGCIVSEITRLYCKPDMTLSWFLRKGALQATFHDWFWKSDHYFLIAFLSNFLSGMLVSKIRFHCKPDMTLSWFLRLRALQVIFYDGFWKSDHDFLIAFHSNLSSGMHGFRDNEVLLKGEYDVNMISSPSGASDDYSGRILKKRAWLSDSDS